MKTLLLPGGFGYIGTHTIVEILKKTKVKIVVIDDYSNCQEDTEDRLFSLLTEE
jgi:UDP-glucose 4-epimerase